MANITLNTKTYTGRGVINSLSTYVELSGGIAASFSPLTASMKMDTKSRVLWKLEVPVVAAEATSCACPGQVLRVSDASIQIRMDLGATVAERTDFALRLKDLVASPEFQASITNLQQPVG